MAIKIKDTGTLADKFAKRASAAQPEYKAGVLDPAVPQQQAAAAAGELWNQAVTEAAGRDAFRKGVTATPADKWGRNAAGKGADRYAGGVNAAKGDWATGTQPYLTALANLTLPARGLRRSAQNIARVQAVIDTLGAVKQARG